MITPPEFIRCFVKLQCRECGKVLNIFNIEWNEAENYARYYKESTGHKCQITMDQMAEVARKMRALRRKQKMSFEEECKAYNQLLKNQSSINYEHSNRIL